MKRGERKDPGELFWSHVEKRGEDECWPWMAFRDKQGYGVFRIGYHADGNRRSIHSHRMAYQIHYGVILPKGSAPSLGVDKTDDVFVCHRCDNPSCCNPKHLFLGTIRDNTADMNNKGRGRPQPPGEAHAMARLTLDQVEDIRRQYAAGGVSQFKLGELFGVSQSQIQLIVTGKRWTNVQERADDMGLFDRVVAAKPAAGGNYPKMGKYWFIIDQAKKGTHQTKSVEFMVFEGKVLYVLDPMEVDNPDPEKHENGRGRGPRAGEPMSINFMDGIEGNEGRLKSFIMGAMSCSDADVTREVLEAACSKDQPMKDIVVEIFSGPVLTKKKKNIVASRVVRRIMAADVVRTLSDADKTLHLGNGRIEKMLADEAAEMAALKK